MHMMQICIYQFNIYIHANKHVIYLQNDQPICMYVRKNENI